MTRVVVSLALLVMLAGFLTPGNSHAGDLKLPSIWHQGDIIVDGNEDDWSGRQTYLEEMKGAIGVANDSEYLYVAISTQREDLMMKMLMSGFTVWLGGDGDKDREFGIRYPAIRRPAPTADRGSGESEARERPDLQSLLATLDSATTEPVLLGIDETIIERLPRNSAGHVAAAMKERDGRLVFELRAPIVRTADHPRAIGAELGEKFALGMETAKTTMIGDRQRQMGDKMGEPPSGGGGPMGGPGGGRGGGMGPGGPGGRGPGEGVPERPKPFELWAKVTLATSAGSNLSEKR